MSRRGHSGTVSLHRQPEKLHTIVAMALQRLVAARSLFRTAPQLSVLGSMKGFASFEDRERGEEVG